MPGPKARRYKRKQKANKNTSGSHNPGASLHNQILTDATLASVGNQETITIPMQPTKNIAHMINNIICKCKQSLNARYPFYPDILQQNNPLNNQYKDAKLRHFSPETTPNHSTQIVSLLSHHKMTGIILRKIHESCVEFFRFFNVQGDHIKFLNANLQDDYNINICKISWLIMLDRLEDILRLETFNMGLLFGSIYNDNTITINARTQPAFQSPLIIVLFEVLMNIQDLKIIAHYKKHQKYIQKTGNIYDIHAILKEEILDGWTLQDNSIPTYRSHYAMYDFFEEEPSQDATLYYVAFHYKRHHMDIPCSEYFYLYYQAYLRLKQANDIYATTYTLLQYQETLKNHPPINTNLPHTSSDIALEMTQTALDISSDIALNKNSNIALAISEISLEIYTMRTLLYYFYECVINTINDSKNAGFNIPEELCKKNVFFIQLDPKKTNTYDICTNKHQDKGPPRRPNLNPVAIHLFSYKQQEQAPLNINLCMCNQEFNTIYEKLDIYTHRNKSYQEIQPFIQQYLEKYILSNIDDPKIRNIANILSQKSDEQLMNVIIDFEKKLKKSLDDIEKNKHPKIISGTLSDDDLSDSQTEEEQPIYRINDSPIKDDVVQVRIPDQPECTRLQTMFKALEDSILNARKTINKLLRITQSNHSITQFLDFHPTAVHKSSDMPMVPVQIIADTCQLACKMSEQHRIITQHFYELCAYRQNILSTNSNDMLQKEFQESRVSLRNTIKQCFQQNTQYTGLMTKIYISLNNRAISLTQLNKSNHQSSRESNENHQNQRIQNAKLRDHNIQNFKEEFSKVSQQTEKLQEYTSSLSNKALPSSDMSSTQATPIYPNNMYLAI
ncbi:MAG: hypothetical protein P857_9 [Candidatus Xenolissoclinum pacificiensis L6]|uniref:Uncharacterized protein n=1 Tax=Candidatus Xenolissoclinum pacificiensis L6 TaxID=1401685 RepID=W2V1M9_9RICK|nr:MAG: hypothetical protein P857_9 [Candidatus Xenolissoclinum pacificiensis L6]